MHIDISHKSNTFKKGENFKCNCLSVKIRGKNNSLIIGDDFCCRGSFNVVIIGNNNKIKLGNRIIIVTNLTIYNHDNSENCEIYIDDETSFYKTEISTYEHNSSIEIGKDCMFAFDTIVYNTDGHAIFQDGQIINKAESLVIGNHVWCGWGSTILKNSKIADGCIVGKGTLVSGKFNEPNTIIAGMPAKVLKRNIFGDRRSINEVLNEKHI